MIRLAVNAVNVAPGGSLSVLLGLLSGWRDIGADLDIRVFIGRPSVGRALQEQGLQELIYETGATAPLKARYWERFKLPGILSQLRTDVLLTNNWYVWNSPCPQIVYHQTLWALFSRSLLPYTWRGTTAVARALLARKALARAEANVFISEHMRRCGEEILPASASRNHVIYNGVAEEFIRAAGARSKYTRSPNVLCALQSLTPHKDNDSLLRSLVELCRIAPDVDWKLRIAGAGDWEHWRRRAAELGIGGRVDFVGFQGLDDIARLLAESACLIYPSVFEGFGMPVVEAMMCECPVVAVDATAIPEIAGEAALLVPPHAPQAIARAVQSICTDDAQREALVSAGRKRARQFAWPESARAFYDLICSHAGKAVAHAAETGA